MNWLIKTYINGKEWSIYPFIPPLFSLALSLLLNRGYQRLYDKRLDDFLKDQGLDQIKPLLKVLLTARMLQVAYLTEMPAFVVSVISAAQAGHPYLLAVLAIAELVLFFTIFPNIFMSEVDYLPTASFPNRRRPAFLAKWNWTQETFYSRLLIIFNIAILVILVITLPDKKGP
jgi:hypothetical protein